MSHEARFVLQTLGLSTATLLVGYFPTVRLAGAEATPSMIAGVVVSLVASWVGAVPVLLSRNRTAEFCPGNMVLAAMLLRFLVVLALALTITLSGMTDRAVFLIWVGISYMVLLIADTQYALRTSAANSRKESN